MGVNRLAYIGANATDIGAWKQFSTQVLGLEVGRDSSDRLLYLRADERHHRLSIHPSDHDDVAYIGWEVANHEALEAVAASLDKHGVKVTPGTSEELADRRVLELVHFTCPYSGARMELTIGNETVFNPRFNPTRDLSGFRTGDLGLGHFVLYASDAHGAAEFYVRTLGLGVSDWVVSPEGAKLAVFLHCNSRHHSMAFINWPSAPRKIQHVFFETNTLDDVGTTYDICLQRDIAKTSVGRHPNDRSVSFYFRNPSHWFIEYGWDLRTIDPQNISVEQYVLRPGIGWGHAGLRNLEG
ncbi:glyoxalase/Bleomycin resistance /Dioxygenase superfamily protein [Burkholderia cenocepacia]|uniref:Glyoxalase/Bleomycin resistance /Dioxygenase superfamily protein n=1 Tax=Burkholderia cenocepacia TaxID=95486 RepID=A0AAN0VL76_9BURK|nr:glyoxalase/Bleomycin resistance /Dioxygenase superfamily protein [Burkholderia cenocepacia]